MVRSFSAVLIPELGDEAGSMPRYVLLISENLADETSLFLKFEFNDSSLQGCGQT
ncbi:2554_t:CDS:2 [Funneliformis caledonium]|uniref:2554_t:CDS:1 n=1 Tax=Funneliformis caledonium TaxID=1117310 RepID=A0A9N8VHX6_9GLOM|nr:2554_t:CDS:2 [Funneliformis caledonium]